MIPFELSWMCCIEPSNLPEELRSLKIGVDSINWYREEIEKYSELVRRVEKEGAQTGSSGKGDAGTGKEKTGDLLVEEFARTFLSR